MTVFRGANPFDQLSPWVKRLLIANFVIFLLQWVAPEPFYTYFSLRPLVAIKKLWLWQFVTYAFLHGNGWHLFFNMFALWMFGSHVEKAMGSKEFIKFYLVCVCGAAITQAVVAPTSLVVGASGGIYGILLAFGLLYPDSIIYFLFVLPLRAIQAVLLIALITFVSAIGSGGSRIAHFAHLGGMLVGFVMLKFPIWRDRFQLWNASRVFRNPRGRRGPFKTKQEDNLHGEVDRILDKISAKGIESLTPDEHRVMQQYAKKKN